jgi:hypothetical protein
MQCNTQECWEEILFLYCDSRQWNEPNVSLAILLIFFQKMWKQLKISSRCTLHKNLHNFCYRCRIAFKPGEFSPPRNGIQSLYFKWEIRTVPWSAMVYTKYTTGTFPKIIVFRRNVRTSCTCNVTLDIKLNQIQFPATSLVFWCNDCQANAICPAMQPVL